MKGGRKEEDKKISWDYYVFVFIGSVTIMVNDELILYFILF